MFSVRLAMDLNLPKRIAQGIANKNPEPEPSSIVDKGPETSAQADGLVLSPSRESKTGRPRVLGYGGTLLVSPIP